MSDPPQLLHGDCFDKLKQMPDNSVESIVTDPPYGISFMNKHWDYSIPSVDIWKECLRVLKPGGHILVACGTKTQHRMAVNIEDAGFEIRDLVAWIYGSGFPKSTNIKKAIEKDYLCQFLDNVKLVKQPLQHFQVESKGEKIGSVLIPVVISQEEGQENLMVIGKVERLLDPMDTYLFASTEKINLNTILFLKKKLEGNLKKGNTVITLTELEKIIDLKIWKLFQFPNTLSGIMTTNHTALKPAMELWTLARKPLSEKTVVANVLKHGTGGINIDGCRVEGKLGGDPNRFAKTDGGSFVAFNTPPVVRESGRFPANVLHDGSEEVEEQFPKATQGHWSKTTTKGFGKFGGGTSEYLGVGEKAAPGSASRFFYCTDPTKISNEKTETHSKSSKAAKGKGIYGEFGSVETEKKDYGRFPANLIHDGSEEVVEKFPDRKGFSGGGQGNGWHKKHTKMEKQLFCDDGSASRFFYCAKAGKKERNKGCNELPDKKISIQQPHNSKTLDERYEITSKNNHPTVKPVALMRYLCRMITPIGGTVLDPFMGSGSTGIAAKAEGFNFIGIEREQNYFEIAEKRINGYT